MASFDSYEKNLSKRLDELRRGDRAYTLNTFSIVETLEYESPDIEETDILRVLDVGCGLGFAALTLSKWKGTQVVGIDPSSKAIELAISEHAEAENLKFYPLSAEEFAEKREALSEPLFNRAVLNMVIHSISDDAAISVLKSIKSCLMPHGSLSLVVPDEVWIVQKLVEKGYAAGMSFEEMNPWGRALMSQKSIDLAVGIRGEKEYDEPITIYNRSLNDYDALLIEAGYGVGVMTPTPQNPSLVSDRVVGFYEPRDRALGYDLSSRDRHLLLTIAR